LEKYLKINLPKITIKKVSSEFLIPQKSLSKQSARIQNANNTFVVENASPCSNILLIDDFVGSGSTLNYIAKKIKSKILNKQVKITCFAISGTPNGIINNENEKFEVVNEA
jgi:hypoxanthine phosphoribosyltransferase